MPDDDSAREFQTHLFFLRHFTSLIWAGRTAVGDHAGLATRLIADQQPLIANIVPIAIDVPARQRLRKYLFAAWNSESLARLSTAHPVEVRRFTNQWKPVQAYYSIYFQLVSLQSILGGGVSGGHAQTVNFGTAQVCQRLPLPWRLRVDFETLAPEELPAAVNLKPAGGWNLGNIDPCEFVANFLRVTGERKQHEVWTKEYRGKKNKRIQEGPRKGKRYRIRDVRVGRLSFFDVLWRFRTWANYREADTIIEGGDFEDWAVEFDALFNTIIESTALLAEHMIRRRVDQAILSELYNEYLALTNGVLACPGIQRRRDLLAPG